MSYHDLSECTLTAEEGRLEADSIVDMLCEESLSEKEREFVDKIGQGWPVSVKQLFWLRNIKDKSTKKENAMSWSVIAAGTPAEARGQLSEQFKGPLAEKPAGLSDDGERVTVQHIADLLEQILATYDAENKVTVSASGHMGFIADCNKKDRMLPVGLDKCDSTFVAKGEKHKV